MKYIYKEVNLTNKKTNYSYLYFLTTNAPARPT